MRHLLIINPNTSQNVSDLLQHHAQIAAGRAALVQTTTARFGAAYISCEASYAVAGHAVLDAWSHAGMQPQCMQPHQTQPQPSQTHSTQAELTQPDAVLIGCFGDPGLLALRESSYAPVTGLAEAAMTQARAHRRFAIVTGGQRWQPMLERLALSLGFADALVGIETVQATGAQLLADPQAAHVLLARACEQAARSFGAHAVILGGAGLAGMAARLQTQLDFPVIDSVTAGVGHALWLAENSSSLAPDHTSERSTLGAWGRMDAKWSGVSPELARMGL
jgi:allantoin racemase